MRFSNIIYLHRVGQAYLSKMPPVSLQPRTLVGTKRLERRFTLLPRGMDDLLRFANDDSAAWEARTITSEWLRRPIGGGNNSSERWHTFTTPSQLSATAAASVPKLDSASARRRRLAPAVSSEPAHKATTSASSGTRAVAPADPILTMEQRHERLAAAREERRAREQLQKAKVLERRAEAEREARAARQSSLARAEEHRQQEAHAAAEARRQLEEERRAFELDLEAQAEQREQARGALALATSHA